MSDQGRVIGENVARARIAAKLSQAELAKRIGAKSQNTIAAIESGNTSKSKYLPNIARALKVRMADLDPEFHEQDTVTIPGGNLVGGVDLDVYGTAEAGNGILVMTSDPVDRVRRPAPLANVRGGYGVIVVGESMEPVLRAGDTILVHPHLPPKVDDLCLFRDEKDGEFRATIKEYRSASKDLWKVHRYGKDPADFTLKKREWPQCHVIVGVYRRR